RRRPAGGGPRRAGGQRRRSSPRCPPAASSSAPEDEPNFWELQGPRRETSGALLACVQPTRPGQALRLFQPGRKGGRPSPSSDTAVPPAAPANRFQASRSQDTTAARTMPSSSTRNSVGTVSIPKASDTGYGAGSLTVVTLCPWRSAYDRISGGGSSPTATTRTPLSAIACSLGAAIWQTGHVVLKKA